MVRLPTRFGPRVLLALTGYALVGIPSVALLLGEYIPFRWRTMPEPERSPLSHRLAALKVRAGVRARIWLSVYRSLPLEGSNGSVAFRDGRYELFMSDHYRVAPAVAVDAMFAHELGHIVRGDCFEPGEMEDMQAGADAFAISLIGEAAFLEGMHYSVEHSGINAYQGDAANLRIINRRAEQLKSRLARARLLLATGRATTAPGY